MGAAAVTERGEETRRQILEVAAISFAEKGYQGTSFSQLIEAAGLTKGAFYFHFPSKEALALAAFSHAQEKWVGAVIAATRPGAPAADQLRAMLDSAVAFYETEPSARCAFRMCMELGEDPNLRPVLMPHLLVWEELVQHLVEQAQREGDYRTDLSARSIARVAVGAFIGIADVARMLSGGEDLRERAEEFLKVFETGLRREGVA